MSRDGAIRRISDYFDGGGFFDDLARRVAIHTESQEPARRAELTRYLTEEMGPYLEKLGFDCVVHENPVARGGPFLVASRHEDDDRPTVMSYGHGDVVEIAPESDPLAATRLDTDHPWARWVVKSIDATSGKETAVLPNLGGSLPNGVFSEVLGLPTIWVPHSYASCSQHAPDEHILEGVSEEALRIMTGLFWDLGEPGTPA